MIERLKKWRWGIGAWVLANGLLIPMIGQSVPPEASAATPTNCAPIVRKGYGSYYRAKVRIVSGAPACAEARSLLWAAMSWDLVKSREGWECHPVHFGSRGFQDQKCIRTNTDGAREVIRSSRPKVCPSCTAIKK